MATTGIWKVEKRLDHVIDYVMNPEKTTKENMSNECYQDYHKFDYDDLDYTSEESCYVSALNCSTHRTYKDMMLTKKLFGKNNGILGYHAFQSFKEGEVTPDIAHKIGIKLAEEMWGDKYEVIVSTHVNTNHIHNHFVINSVSFVDGKKYHDCNESLAVLRHLSDSLCEEYGLSVLKEENCKKGKVKYSNYYNNYVRHSNYHTMAQKDVDRAIGMAYSYQDFENILKKMGYEVTVRYGKLSIKRPPYKKNIRIERAFGIDYSIENIGKRIETTTSPRVPFIEAYDPKNQVKTLEEAKKEKSHGVYGLYKYYCYILKVYPKQYPKKILSPALRLDIEKMNEISEQTRLLVSNHIETYEQFLFYKNSLDNSVNELLGKKQNLWKKYNRTKDDNERGDIYVEIKNISMQLVPLRKEAKVCENIEKKFKEVQENIKEFEENEIRKEKEK